MIISEAEFQDWKSNLVTKAFFEAALERVEDTKEILAVSAGLNPDQDNYLRGFIQAYKEMTQFSVERDDA